MPILILEDQYRAQLLDWLVEEKWVIACLCAAWCDTCRTYRDKFEQLSAQHPDKHFVWIDIENQAELVGDIDVENFPTLLIQQAETVVFFGTVLPDIHTAHRLIQVHSTKSPTELNLEATTGSMQRKWQRDCNLLVKLKEILG